MMHYSAICARLGRGSKVTTIHWTKHQGQHLTLWHSSDEFARHPCPRLKHTDDGFAHHLYLRLRHMDDGFACHLCLRLRHTDLPIILSWGSSTWMTGLLVISVRGSAIRLSSMSKAQTYRWWVCPSSAKKDLKPEQSYMWIFHEFDVSHMVTRYHYSDWGWVQAVKPLCDATYNQWCSCLLTGFIFAPQLLADM